MIDALVKLKSGKGDEGELSSLIQQVYLVGSADVVRALNSYLEIFTGDREIQKWARKAVQLAFKGYAY